MSWFIGKDNRVKANPREWRRLKAPRRLTDRKCFIECPHVPIADQEMAKLIAMERLGAAVIGGCGTIIVRGPRWNYEFDTLELNREARRKGRGRSGMVHNPIEDIVLGSFYDVTRKLWVVPKTYNVRESVKFPTTQRAA